MLLKTFYSILEQQSIDEVSFEAHIEIQKNHPIFEGHFPDYPVTPGVGMLQILKELTENQLSQKLFLQSASHVKFLSIVNPNLHSHLHFLITLTIEDKLIKVKNSTSLLDGTPVLKCNVTFVKR